MKPLETDGEGNVLLKPLTGWTIGPVADIAVLLVIEYVSTPEELERGDRQAIQFVLTPLKCLELAEVLKKQANDLLEPLPSITALN